MKCDLESLLFDRGLEFILLDNSVCLQVCNSVLMVRPASGYEPRDEGHEWGGAARPGDVVESRSQNQDPAGAGRGGRACQLHRSALCNADQVLQTGTDIHTDS